MTKKPVILVFPFNLMSHYLRCIELCKLLKDDHEILFAHSHQYFFWTQNAGFKSFSCEEISPDEVMQCARKLNFSWLNEKDLERVFLDQVKNIEELQPVAVIGDVSSTLKMAAEKCHVPFISLINGYMTKYYFLTRKLSKTHPAFKYSEKLPANFSDFITRKAERMAFRQIHKPFRKIRKKYRLSSTEIYLDELEGDHNLICDLPEVFPQSSLPGNYTFIGPLYYKDPASEKDLIKGLDKSKPSILVSLGSTGDWEQLQALKHAKFSQFNIITAGDTQNILKGEHINGNSFVNIPAMLPHIDLMICHGGNGTIYQALTHDVPLLMIPGIFEQEWNARRIEELGLGKVLTGRETPDELLNLIETFLDKPTNSFRERILFYQKQQKEILQRIFDLLLLTHATKIGEYRKTTHLNVIN